MTYYEVLGVPRHADPEAIRRAFCRLARRYHPDAGRGSSAEKFRQVREAYVTLGNCARRLEYDRTMMVTGALGRRSPWEELFEQFARLIELTWSWWPLGRW